jgi:succinoglycan biosynthesis transport protein ExoP
VKQAIVGVGGSVLGVVMNNVDLKHDQNYYYYTSYYAYHPTGAERKSTRRGRPAVATARNGASKPDEY